MSVRSKKERGVQIATKIATVAKVAFLVLKATADCAALTARRQSCNVTADLTDRDPIGANVRATPGGPVIAGL